MTILDLRDRDVDLDGVQQAMRNYLMGGTGDFPHKLMISPGQEAALLAEWEMRYPRDKVEPIMRAPERITILWGASVEVADL